MVINRNANCSTIKQDFVHITILLTIALVIGVYLIATSVLISQDGVFYIERAQQITSEPIKIIRQHPPGYPFMIFLAHKFVNLFTDNSSNLIWIYSAQGMTLLCKLLALIPLYFIGKFLVGSRNSFWALFIFMILPYPTRFGCEVVREWPYILFLAGGFLSLLFGIKRSKLWAFGLVGLLASMGYLIRPMSIQLVIYGFIWLVLCMLRPKLCKLSRRKVFLAIVLLLVSFFIPIMPYIKCTGHIIPSRVNNIIDFFSHNTHNTLPDKTYNSGENIISVNYYLAQLGSHNVVKAFGEIFKRIGENLMWFFLPVLFVGLCSCFKQKTDYKERFLIAAFILINIIVMVSRYCYVQMTISKRWSLPLIALTIFYIPVGLQIIGNWFECKFPINKHKPDISKEPGEKWFSILLLIGVCICLPKLFRPVRIEKQGYRDATEWLLENTAAEDVVAVPDVRIAFYAERKGVVYDEELPKWAEYFVRIRKIEDEEVNPGRTTREEYSVWVDKRKKRKKLIIYKMLK